jgi:hypothetical protein
MYTVPCTLLANYLYLMFKTEDCKDCVVIVVIMYISDFCAYVYMSSIYVSSLQHSNAVIIFTYLKR